MSKNNKFLYFMLLLGNLAGAQVFPFDSVRTAVLYRNPELKIYQNQAKAYDAMAEGSRAWEAPQIGAGFFMTPYRTSYWNDRNEMVEGMPTMMPGMGNFMIQAKQMIMNPYKLKANQKYQQSLSSVEEEKGKATANKLLFQAKTLYCNLQILDKKLTLLEETKSTVETMIKLGERKIAYNQESLSSIYKARSQAALLEKDKWMMEGERRQKRVILNGLMNRTKDFIFSVDTALKIKEYERMQTDTLLLAGSRSDILSMEKTIEVMRLKQMVEVSKNRPDFGIEYGHMFAFGSNPNQFTLMGMMSIPIAPWSSKMYKSTAKATLFEIEAMKNQKEAMVTETLSMIEGLKSEITSAKYQLKLYQEVVLPSLRKAYEVAMLAYGNNTGELFMALDAKMGLQMAEMQYWDTMLNLLKLQAEYERELQLL